MSSFLWRYKVLANEIYNVCNICSDSLTEWQYAWLSKENAGLILGLHQVNERRRYFVTTSLIGCVQA